MHLEDTIFECHVLHQGRFLFLVTPPPSYQLYIFTTHISSLGSFVPSLHSPYPSVFPISISTPVKSSNDRFRSSETFVDLFSAVVQGHQYSQNGTFRKFLSIFRIVFC